MTGWTGLPGVLRARLRDQPGWKHLYKEHRQPGLLTGAGLGWREGGDLAPAFPSHTSVSSAVEQVWHPGIAPSTREALRCFTGRADRGCGSPIAVGGSLASLVPCPPRLGPTPAPGTHSLPAAHTTSLSFSKPDSPSDWGLLKSRGGFPPPLPQTHPPSSSGISLSTTSELPPAWVTPCLQSSHHHPS